MSILFYIYLAISCFLIFYLVFPFITIFFSLFSREKIKTKEELGNDYQEHDFGCIIPAWKYPDITKPLVQSLIDQPYPNFHIYLVADNCDLSNFDLEHENLTVFNPDPILAMKAKSIIHAMENYVRPHDYTVVFDHDNLAHPDFLFEINKYINNGHKAVQGQRTAKNLDTVYACADATGEFYKNYIDRYVPYMLGSSTVIAGSGMAVETKLYADYMASPEIQQGKTKGVKMLLEDKILQNYLATKNEKISYATNAIVYDEKVETGDAVESQRSRWLYSYFQNIPNSTGFILKGLFGFNWNQLLFGLITFAPPLFILLFFSMVMSGVGLFFDPIVSLVFVGAIAIFCLTILWTLYLSNAPKQVWKAIWGLPLFIMRQVTALLKLGNPTKNFKGSAPTRQVSIDDIMKDK